MIAIRGNIRSMRSDNGTNFVGIENELKRAFQEMNHTKIKHFFSGKWSRLAGFDKKHPNCKSYGWGMGATKKIRNIL